jgi:hypothetical protein
MPMRADYPMSLPMEEEMVFVVVSMVLMVIRCQSHAHEHQRLRHNKRWRRDACHGFSSGQHAVHRWHEADIGTRDQRQQQIVIDVVCEPWCIGFTFEELGEAHDVGRRYVVGTPRATRIGSG